MEGKYFTELAAKRDAAKYFEPFIVRFSDGTYDWFGKDQEVGYYENGKFVESVNYTITSTYYNNRWHNRRGDADSI
jgi:hypothetical protein